MHLIFIQSQPLIQNPSLRPDKLVSYFVLEEYKLSNKKYFKYLTRQLKSNLLNKSGGNHKSLFIFDFKIQPPPTLTRGGLYITYSDCHSRQSEYVVSYILRIHLKVSLNGYFKMLYSNYI